MAATPTPLAGRQMRPRTTIERQPFSAYSSEVLHTALCYVSRILAFVVFAYGAAISLVSPYATLYQLCRLNPQVSVTQGRMIRLAATIFPAQTLLKVIQMNASTPIKEYLNPWAAFAAVGVLQGGVYGQATIYYSRQLGLNKKVDLRGLFRGAGFAATRDVISQGVPFMLSGALREAVFDPLVPAEARATEPGRFLHHWGPILAASIASTYASQPFMNLQLTMQSDPELSHATTITRAWARNGPALLYRGAEARIGLLLVVNVLNELLLKPAWADVEVEDAVPGPSAV